MLNLRKIYAKLPWSGEKGFDSGIVITKKSEILYRLQKKIKLDDECVEKNNQMKENEPNLNEIKRQSSVSVSHMLPWWLDGLNEYLQRFSIQLL